MHLNKIILIFVSFSFLISCRYKNNDKLVIATVKQRLEKTWYLKERIWNDVVINVNYISTLKIEIPSKNLINISCNNLMPYNQYYFNNKTSIKPKDASDRVLKITKLTRSELWMEGSCILPDGWSDLTSKVVLKYSTKP